MSALSTIPALPLVFAIPLLWVIFSVLARQHAGLALTATGAALQVAAALLLWWQVKTGGEQLHALGGWAEPLGIGLRVDGLAVTFVLLTAVVSAACAIHAHFYLRARQELQRYFWPLLWFLWAGLNGIWIAADIFNLYVGLELVSLCAVGLVAVTGDTGSIAAALRYLLAALTGSLSYLLGVALLYGASGTLAIAQLAGELQPGITVALALGLMSAGLLVKTALFPLHGWLPPAHGGALAPVSALLSALVIKASFYILLRLWLAFGEAFDGEMLANMLGVLGTLAIAWGSWRALHEEALKMVVAYSTVAQVGYFFLFFPLATGVAPVIAQLALEGTVLLVASHALAKAAMFLAAGNLISMMGQDRVSFMTGISRYRPVSLFSFGLASVTLMGLPPSGGFNAKWLLLQSALASGRWAWIGVLLLGGLATAAYVFRIFRLSFREDKLGDTFNPLSPWLELAPMLLALLAIVLGLATIEPLALLGPARMAEVAQ